MTRPGQQRSYLGPIICIALAMMMPSGSCTKPGQPPPPTQILPQPTRTGSTQTGPKLIQDGDDWYITGLSPDAASAIEQGRLFAVSRPIPGTPDVKPVAVFVALQPPGGSTVQVGHQCTALGKEAELRPGLLAKALASNTNTKVGQCLARIVGEDTSTDGIRYIILDVGEAFGLRSLDEYKILGKSVNAAGYVPLGLATDMDGLCQIPEDPTYLKANTTRCLVLESPPDRKELRNGFVVWKSR